MRTIHAAAVTVAALLLGACSGSSSGGSGGPGPTDPTSGNGAPTPAGPTPPAFRPLFQLAQGLIPPEPTGGRGPAGQQGIGGLLAPPIAASKLSAAPSSALGN